jgi:hypothetical protein
LLAERVIVPDPVLANVPEEKFPEIVTEPPPASTSVPDPKFSALPSVKAPALVFSNEVPVTDPPEILTIPLPLVTLIDPAVTPVLVTVTVAGVPNVTLSLLVKVVLAAPPDTVDQLAVLVFQWREEMLVAQ